jgi:hypothetical protein
MRGGSTAAKEGENLNSNREEIPPSMYMKTKDRNSLNRSKNAILISSDGGAVNLDVRIQCTINAAEQISAGWLQTPCRTSGGAANPFLRTARN